jgi:hypothetical protein
MVAAVAVIAAVVIVDAKAPADEEELGCALGEACPLI